MCVVLFAVQEDEDSSGMPSRRLRPHSLPTYQHQLPHSPSRGFAYHADDLDVTSQPNLLYYGSASDGVRHEARFQAAHHKFSSTPQVNGQSPPFCFQ